MRYFQHQKCLKIFKFFEFPLCRQDTETTRQLLPVLHMFVIIVLRNKNKQLYTRQIIRGLIWLIFGLIFGQFLAKSSFTSPKIGIYDTQPSLQSVRLLLRNIQLKYPRYDSYRMTYPLFWGIMAFENSRKQLAKIILWICKIYLLYKLTGAGCDICAVPFYQFNSFQPFPVHLHHGIMPRERCHAACESPLDPVWLQKANPK